MPVRSLILALALIALPAVAQVTDPAETVAQTAARMKAFPIAQSVESPDAYQPAETVRGRPRALADATAFGGVSVEAIARAQDYADAQGSFALIVLRDGKLVHERYATGFTAASRFSPASMHKTVMALAFGTARLPLDGRVDRWLTEWRGDPRGAITLRQLLTMSSGLAAPPFSQDPGSVSAQMMFGPDTVKAALSLPLGAVPGATFSYANANSQLAGAVLERATGKRYADLLSTRIWQPIGASDATVWLDRPGGAPHFFCCLQATARDWARVGQLILDGGRVGGKANGRQIVPAAWIAEMAKPAATNPNYGLQLWRGSPYVVERKYNATSPLVGRAAKPYARDDVLFMDGAVGQRVYVVPSERLVIVRIGKSSMTWDDSELPNRLLAGIAPARP